VARSPEYAAALDRGVEVMRKNGRLAEILKKYGIDDWE
jgi:ABC-type amino acid transport substrate-binding protein